MQMDSVSEPQADTIVFGRAVFTMERTNTHRSYEGDDSDSMSMDFKDRSPVSSVYELGFVMEGRDDLERGPFDGRC